MAAPAIRAAVVAVGLSAAAVLSTAQSVAPGALALPDEALAGFVEVPAGTVTMGSGTADAYDNERWSATSAEGTVTLGPFLIGRREVTTRQFAAFAAATGWRAEPRALAGPPDHPVTFVSWTDAVAYCRWLDRQLRTATTTPAALAARLRDGWRVTLPTEAQWERAARGDDRRPYPWGDTARRDRANFAGTATTPAGRFPCPECPFGLEDMSGNVWEWTRSPYQPYPYDDADDRRSLDADALWVIRGGHFGDPARLVRTSARGAAEPGARRPFIGFRLALAPAPQPGSF
ncbi:MAG: formylglycine-generating enzyme family protein [Vicinamibacterales bacterium]